MLRPLSVKRPSTTTMIEMTMATIGRRMKKCAMGRSSVRGGLDRLRIDDQSIAHALQAVDDDALAGLEPVLDDPVVVDPRPRLDGADAHFVLGADDGHLVCALDFLHGALRNDDRVLLR